MTIARSFVLVFFLVSAGMLASGCGQQDGQVCQGGASSTDCAAGLTCQCALGGGPDARGICHPPGAACAVVTQDSGPRPDTGPVDAGSEAGTNEAGTNEAGTDDGGSDGGSDAGSDGGTDAATSVDASIDATNDAG